MRRQQEKTKKKNILLPVVLLAVSCIAAVELLVCSVADPVLYERIMAPVRACAYQVMDAGQAVCGKIAETGKKVGQAAAHTGQKLCANVAKVGQSIGEGIQGAKDSVSDCLGSLMMEQEQILSDVENQLADEVALAPPTPIVDPSVSCLEVRDGTEYLTGGGIEITYFNQADPQWASQPYGTDALGGSGCGPTAMAMVAATLSKKQADPAQMAQFCVSTGYWSRGQGSAHSIVEGVAAAYGLECTPIAVETLDRDSLMASLATGNLVVALMKKGHFTNGGHYIVLRGVTLGGEVLVADPASRERSLTAWDLSLILDELSSSRDSGAPLWLVTLPAAV